MEKSQETQLDTTTKPQEHAVDNNDGKNFVNYDDIDATQVIAHGLLKLSEDELKALDKAITPDIATLLGKAFGDKLLQAIGPLYLEDNKEGINLELTEGDLRALMRKPAYWRDRDPDILAQVSQGYKRLYG